LPITNLSKSVPIKQLNASSGVLTIGSPLTLNEVLTTIEHLNFSNISYENFNLDKLYQINDIASHLSPKYHNEIFIKKIIEKLN
jgi:hypothetical protein